MGIALRWLYFTQLRMLPRSWGATLRHLERDTWAFRGVQRLLGLLGARLVREVADAQLVMSTHPFASQALGEARLRGRLRAPVVTYLTDASVHRLWVHPAVDLHLAITDLAAAQAAELGGTATPVRPVVTGSTTAICPDWRAPWPAGRPTALVVGGSCGVGELYESALDLLATGLVTPVVACGSNTVLHDKLAGVPGVIALGWRDDMPALVAAASCVVQNAGGMTSLEALAAGTPTLTYRPIAGHGTSNAEMLHRAALVPWVDDPADLGCVVASVLATSESFSLPEGAPSVSDVLVRHCLLTQAPELVAA